MLTALRFTDKKLRALFCKFGEVLGVKMESKFGVVKVLEGVNGKMCEKL
jgi:hypothetical protein